MFIALMGYVGYLAERGVWYLVGLVFAAVLAVYHQHLIRDREPNRCFEAFLNNNYLGMVLFLGLVLDYAAG